MSLHRVVADSLRWFFSIGTKFIQVVPSYTLAVVLANLTSQMSMLLAFFLPIKVIILLGTPGIPTYFPRAWQSVERDHLIISLAAGATGFYLLYLLAEKTVVFCAERGASRLLEKSQKISLPKNQEKFALRAYHRYASSLAGLVFVGLTLVFVGATYPVLVLVVLLYGLIVFAFLSRAFARNKKLRTGLAEDVKTLMNTLGAMGFLLAFAFIVSDFLIGRPPGMIVAIVCLLLMRQMMVRLSGSITNLSALFAQRLQINALFGNVTRTG